MEFTLPLEEARKLAIGKPRIVEENTQSAGFVLRLPDRIRGAEPLGDDPLTYLVGFSAVCTHMGCILVDSESGVVRRGTDTETEALACGPCVCHGTTFDLLRAGLVVLGPATQHLPQLRLEVSGEEVRSVGWFGDDDAPNDEKWPCETRTDSA